MMKNIIKWLPFSAFLIVALSSVIYLIFYGAHEPYYPTTDNPKIIYNEACATCHGRHGEGEGILYPDLQKEKLNRTEIAEIIRNGSWRMPDFKFITNDTLNALIEYVYNQEYSKSD